MNIKEIVEKLRSYGRVNVSHDMTRDALPIEALNWLTTTLQAKEQSDLARGREEIINIVTKEIDQLEYENPTHGSLIFLRGFIQTLRTHREGDSESKV